ncbi:MAG: Mu transposase C-terminal domain-containing protein [Stellaceae bacterium]
MVDVSLVSEAAWCEARRRAEVLRPLAERAHRPRHLVRAAAATLGLSERQTYTLLQRCREAGGDLTALLPGKSSGGRDKPRIAPASEGTLERLIREFYLTPQKPTAARLVREVRGRCGAEEVPVPSANTIRRRIKALSPADRRRRGEELPQSNPVHGHAPAARHPLDLVQIDHTPVDLILVDPTDREPIGRPWITVAVDAYSRCLAGFHVTLEAPSATSVGLCLTHAAMDKASWLMLRDVEANWPVQGKPRRVGVDNASEFHSQAFERGCAQHGIAIEWRPPGRPHFGGVVERVIGTLMGLVHGLPGTTFSDIGQRGRYDSDKAACLTLEELERWLAIAIAKFYHLRPHEGLEGQTPLRRWQEGVAALVAAGGTIPVPRDPRAYFVDFLPVLRRSLQRDGITIDHLTYFSSALRAWIIARNRPGALLIRRDPRDLSRVFVLDPLDDNHLEVPTRDLSRVGHLVVGVLAGAAPLARPAPRRSGRGGAVCCRRGDARGRARGDTPDPFGAARSRAPDGRPNRAGSAARDTRDRPGGVCAHAAGARSSAPL